MPCLPNRCRSHCLFALGHSSVKESHRRMSRRCSHQSIDTRRMHTTSDEPSAQLFAKSMSARSIASSSDCHAAMAARVGPKVCLLRRESRPRSRRVKRASTADRAHAVPFEIDAAARAEARGSASVAKAKCCKTRGVVLHADCWRLAGCCRRPPRGGSSTLRLGRLQRFACGEHRVRTIVARPTDAAQDDRATTPWSACQKSSSRGGSGLRAVALL